MIAVFRPFWQFQCELQFLLAILKVYKVLDRKILYQQVPEMCLNLAAL